MAENFLIIFLRKPIILENNYLGKQLTRIDHLRFYVEHLDWRIPFITKQFFSLELYQYLYLYLGTRVSVWGPNKNPTMDVAVFTFHFCIWVDYVRLWTEFLVHWIILNGCVMYYDVWIGILFYDHRNLAGVLMLNAESSWIWSDSALSFCNNTWI